MKILRTPFFTEHFRWLLLIVFKPSMGLYCPHSGMIYNPFLTNVLIFYSLKTVENQRFSLGALFRNGLNSVAPDAMVQRCSVKEVFTKISLIYRKTLMLESKLQAVRDSNTGVFLWILRNFKSTYFEQHLRTAASIILMKLW